MFGDCVVKEYMFKKYKNFIIYRYMEQLISRYKKTDLSAMSAEIAYYLMLSIFPFLIFIINLLSFTPLSNELLYANLNAFLPNDTGILLKSMLVEALYAKSGTIMFISMLGGLWIASQGISAITRGLNKAYDAEENRNFVKLFFLALIATFGLTIMMMFEFILIIFGEIIGTYVFGLIGAKKLFVYIWSFLRYCISLVWMIFTFSLLYKYLPNRKLKFGNVVIGAIFSSVGLVLISVLFSFYVNNFGNYTIVYGGLGGIIALMMWFYFSTMIILLGGEVIAIHSDFQNKRKI